MVQRGWGAKSTQAAVSSGSSGKEMKRKDEGAKAETFGKVFRVVTRMQYVIVTATF